MAKTAENPFRDPAYNGPLEPDKVVSWPRFKRGFKSGFRFAMFKQAIGLPLLAITAATLAPPEVQSPIMEHISNIQPGDVPIILGAVALAEAELGVCAGTIGGAIDSFRPTSRQFERYLAFNGFKVFSGAFDVAKNIDYNGKAAETVNGLMGLGRGTARLTKAVGNLGYNIIRPELPEKIANNPLKTIEYSTEGGAGVGVSLVASSWFIERLESLPRLFPGSESDPNWIAQAILAQPVETVIATTAAGLVVSTYALAAGRYPRPAKT